MSVLYFLVFCLTFILFGYLVYLIAFSSLARHFDELRQESQKLDDDIKLKKADLAGLLNLVDYNKNRLYELNREYVLNFSEKNKK